MKIIYILFIVLIILCISSNQKSREEFDDFNFNYATVNSSSKQTSDISDGNPISLSGIPNAEELRQDIKDTDLNRITYQANGIPLKYEERRPFPEQQSVSDLTDYMTKPDCCPSLYSSRSGCLSKWSRDIARNDPKYQPGHKIQFLW